MPNNNGLLTYNDTILDKFTAIYPNTVWASTEEAFKRAEEKFHKLEFPLISIFRSGIEKSTTFYNRAQVFEGPRMGKNLQKTLSIQARNYPIRLTFQLDLWTTSIDDHEQMLAEIIYFILDDPKLLINPIDTQKFIFDLEIDSIEDNSDIISEEDKGRIYRYSIGLVIDDARLFRCKAIKICNEVPITLGITNDNPVTESSTTTDTEVVNITS